MTAAQVLRSRRLGLPLSSPALMTHRIGSFCDPGAVAARGEHHPGACHAATSFGWARLQTPLLGVSKGAIM